MAALNELLDYTHRFLEVDRFDDYAPNGLQVEGEREIGLLVGGVTASQSLLDAAAEAGADAVLVHHGFFWKGESPVITGMKYRRIRRLIDAGMALIAYHLPLDAHPEVGNNALLGRLLQFEVEGSLPPESGAELVWHGRPRTPMSAEALAARIGEALGREPLHIEGGPETIRTIGWCSGAAQGYLPQAAAAGLDAYISGEISEQTVHVARELGIHYFSAGHHATERQGVQALGGHLAKVFGLEFRFLDIPNPV